MLKWMKVDTKMMNNMVDTVPISLHPHSLIHSISFSVGGRRPTKPQTGVLVKGKYKRG